MKVMIAGLAAAAFLLAGCATQTTTGQAPGTPAPTQPEPTEPEPTAPESTAPESTSPESTEPGPTESAPEPCEDLVFQRAQTTIRSQQDALGNDDFQAAWGFASPSFRSSVTVDAFQGIIEGTYPFLLDNPELRFVECQRQGETAFLQVEVAGSPTVVMVYRVVLNEDVWFVDAASIAGNREDVTT
jgi:hypothetical protein